MATGYQLFYKALAPIGGKVHIEYYHNMVDNSTGFVQAVV